MFYEELSLEEALQKVRRVRYYANPNSGFINQLKQFEYELKLNKGSLDDCIKNKNIKNL
jgi:hypothetical protein